jgi:very-short-patch-repair endonuclease
MAKKNPIFGTGSRSKVKASGPESAAKVKGSSKRDSPFSLFASEVSLPRRPSLPKVERPPIFSRAWAGLADAVRPAENITGPPEQPQSGPFAVGLATKPEWYVNWGLLRNGKKNGVDFDYRGEVEFLPSLAAKAQLDFTMKDGSQIAIEVQGIHWHYELGFEKIAQDAVRRTELMSSGRTVIQIDEDDALRDPDYYVREALAGRDHSYSTSPVFYQPWK